MLVVTISLPSFVDVVASAVAVVVCCRCCKGDVVALVVCVAVMVAVVVVSYRLPSSLPLLIADTVLLQLSLLSCHHIHMKTILSGTNKTSSMSRLRTGRSSGKRKQFSRSRAYFYHCYAY